MRNSTFVLTSSLLVLLSVAACGDKDDTGEDGTTDGGSTDGGSTDGGTTDGGTTDGGSTDGGSTDGGSTDGGSTDGGSTDGGATDGGATDGGSSDGGSAKEEANGSVTLTDYPTGATIVGATVTLGADTYTTDAKGHVDLTVPTWSAYQFTATAEGYLNMTAYGYNDDSGFSQGLNMVSRTAANSVYGATGLSYDTDKGTTVASVWDFSEGTGVFLAGATVELGATAQLTLAADSTQALGFSAGSTTLEDSSAWILFLNHDVGSATPSITPPAGFSCTIFPGEETAVAFDLEADTLNIVTFACFAD